MLNIVSYQRKAVFMKWSKMILMQGDRSRSLIRINGTTTTMIIAENISDMTTDELNGLLGIDFVFGLILACPSTSYSSMQSSHRIKKSPKKVHYSHCHNEGASGTRHFMYWPSKYGPSYSWGGVFHAADINMQSSYGSYRSRLAKSQQSIPSLLATHRHSLHKLLSSSPVTVHTVKQGNMRHIAETKAHLWEAHKWTWEFHCLLVSFQNRD